VASETRRIDGGVQEVRPRAERLHRQHRLHRLLLTSTDDGFNRPEHTMVDGIIGMSLVDRGMRV